MPTAKGSGSGLSGLAKSADAVHLGRDRNVEAVRSSAREQLPVRLRIVNQLLWGEMCDVCNFELDHDQAAPFRSLILYEQEFRQAHANHEAEFAAVSIRQPSHPAVLWTGSCGVPIVFGYGVKGPISVAYDNTWVLRIKLNGFRALMLLFDTNLRGLVETATRIQRHKGAFSQDAVFVEPVPRLPFSHLYYLFGPGDTVVRMHPDPQVYRVLQVCGGRMSLVSRADSRSRTRRTISDLAVDCVHLDFDGKEFGPVYTTFKIRPYIGSQDVSSLSVFPLCYAADGLQASLVERGRKMHALDKARHRKYRGLSLKEGERFDTLEEVCFFFPSLSSFLFFLANTNPSRSTAMSLSTSTSPIRTARPGLTCRSLGAGLRPRRTRRRHTVRGIRTTIPS